MYREYGKFSFLPVRRHAIYEVHRIGCVAKWVPLVFAGWKDKPLCPPALAPSLSRRDRYCVVLPISHRHGHKVRPTRRHLSVLYKSPRSRNSSGILRNGDTYLRTHWNFGISLLSSSSHAQSLPLFRPHFQYAYLHQKPAEHGIRMNSSNAGLYSVSGWNASWHGG